MHTVQQPRFGDLVIRYVTNLANNLWNMPNKPIDDFNCTIGHLIVDTNIVSFTGRSIPLLIFVSLSEMAIPSAGDLGPRDNLGPFSELEPHQFVNYAERWYENGASTEFYQTLVPQEFQSGWHGLSSGMHPYISRIPTIRHRAGTTSHQEDNR